MRTLIVSALLIGSFVIAAPAAKALTTDGVEAKIAALMAQIETLQKQLAELTQKREVAIENAQTTAANPVCYKPTRALRTGLQGEDVRALQQVLADKGYYAGEVTGYFGPLTEKAVQLFQKDQGIVLSGSPVTTGFGVAGPATRKILWPCNDTTSSGIGRFVATPTSGPAPLLVTFKTWISGFRAPGHTYTIDYGDGVTERANDCYAPADACLEAGKNEHTYTSNGTYTAVLYHVIDPCVGQTACRAAIHREVVAKTTIMVGQKACTKEYSPVCALKPIVCITTPCNPIPTTYGNSCMAEADGAAFIYSGECVSSATNPEQDPQCKIWSDGCNTCSRSTPGGPGMCTLMACQVTDNYTPKPYCKEYFDSATSTPNKAPTIVSFTGPSQLKVGQIGTWSVKATDPENNQMTYDVVWGDEHGNALPMLSFDLPQLVTQATSFTHTYYAGGMYTITITVRDSKGATVNATATVKVGDTPTACTLQYDPVCGAKPIVCITTPCNPIPTTYGNRCAMEADGASFLYAGECKTNTTPPAPNPESDPQCKVWYDGCNTCSRSTPGGPAMCTMMACMTIGTIKPYCKEQFTTSTTNKAPSISSFSGPTTLKQGEAGTWTIKATDPEGGSLTYDVTWGDEYGNIAAMTVYDGAKAFTQSSTVTHTYLTGGTYTVMIIVTDNKGATAKATATVKVGSDTPIACTMQYDPVCGRPAGCMNTCPAGMYCAMMCQLHPVQTYGNRCMLDAAQAEFVSAGACPASGSSLVL